MDEPEFLTLDEVLLIHKVQLERWGAPEQDANHAPEACCRDEVDGRLNLTSTCNA